MPEPVYREYSSAPVRFATSIWSTSWSFRPPKLIQAIGRLLARVFPVSWTHFWRTLGIADRTSFGFWVQHHVDHFLGQPAVLTGWYRGNIGLYRESNLDDGQIRLIKIQPSDDFYAPLALDMFAVSLDSEPEYMALSYVWGEGAFHHTIRINGRRCEVPVGTYQGLLHTRYHCPDTLLWVDAICIDQDNVGEKNQQVSMMSQIFEAAQEVLIYLGSDDVEHDTRHLPLTGIVESASGHQGSESEIGMVALRELLLGPGLGALSFVDRDTNALRLSMHNVMRRSWFYRYWTVQEAALANRTRLVIGKRAIIWENDPTFLRKALQRIKYAEVDPWWDHLEMPDMRNLQDVLEMQLAHVVRRTGYTYTETKLLDILHMFKKSRRRATMPQDQIYALLALVPPVELRDFNIDYSESFEDLYNRLIDLITANAASLFPEFDCQQDSERLALSGITEMLGTEQQAHGASNDLAEFVQRPDGTTWITRGMRHPVSAQQTGLSLDQDAPPQFLTHQSEQVSGLLAD